jgi:hypothetical protein
MGSQVTYSNLFSESRNNVKDLISANVTNPVVSSGEYRKWIYSREPDVKASDFAGYPFVIVHPSDVDVGEGGSLDGKSKMVEWNIEVEIVTSDRGYGDKDGLGLSHMDTISNSVISVLLNKTNRTTLSTNSMYFSQPTTAAVSTDIVANERVYRRSIFAPFKSRMRVSA